MPAPPTDRSARRADYYGGSKSMARQPLPSDLTIEPCADLTPLADVRGALKKLKHEKSFLCKVFEARDRQLFPKDILVAYIPSKKGKPRAIGVLRRSQGFDKVINRASLSIDFVWVMPEFRACGLGRALMAEGMVAGSKPKDVHLQVAGSENNTTAVALYSSLGFAWDDDAPKLTEMVLRAERVEEAVAKARAHAEERRRLFAEAAAAGGSMDGGGGSSTASCSSSAASETGEAQEEQQPPEEEAGAAAKEAGGGGAQAERRLEPAVTKTPATVDVCDEDGKAAEES